MLPKAIVRESPSISMMMWLLPLLVLVLFVPAQAARDTGSDKTPAGSTKASDTPTKTSDVYGQPWVVNTGNFSMLAFSLGPEVVKKHLPPGLQPLVNDKGKVNSFLEVYGTEQISGLATYKAAFLVIEVAGHPSRTGVPGHFAIWGRIDSSSSLEFFTRELGFPYQLAPVFQINKSEGLYKANLGDELSFRLQASQAPFAGEGVVDMLSVKPGKGLFKVEVPYITRAAFSTVLEFKVTPKADPALKLLGGVVPDWSLISEQQIFAYAHLVPVTKQ